MGQIRIDDSLHRKLKVFSGSRIGTMRQWVEKWVREGMDAAVRDEKKRRR